MTQLATAIESSRRPMTIEEWGDLDEDEEGEFVDGAIEEDEVPYYLHEIVVAYLIAVLRAWAHPRNGVVGGSEAKFRVKASRGRKPDLSVYLNGRRPPMNVGLIRFPPDIMVEVVSPRPRDARRDRVAKLDEYAVFGVPFYWIVDPQIRSFEVYERTADGRYVRALGAEAGVLSNVPGCEGLVLDLDGLWSEVDGLGAGGGEASEA